MGFVVYLSTPEQDIPTRIKHKLVQNILEILEEFEIPLVPLDLDDEAFDKWRAENKAGYEHLKDLKDVCGYNVEEEDVLIWNLYEDYSIPYDVPEGAGHKAGERSTATLVKILHCVCQDYLGGTVSSDSDAGRFWLDQWDLMNYQDQRTALRIIEDNPQWLPEEPRPV